MKSLYIILSTILIMALSVPTYGKKDSTEPGIYRNWNSIDYMEILQPFKISDYTKLIVLPLDTSEVSLPPMRDNTYEPVTNVLSRINGIFMMGLKKGFKEKLNIVPEKIDEKNIDVTLAGALLIKTKVTEMNPGSFALRFWIRFGAGKTRVEMAGEIWDPNSNTVLLKFRHARVSARRIAFYERVLTGDAMDVSEDIGRMLLNF